MQPKDPKQSLYTAKFLKLLKKSDTVCDYNI